MRIAHGIDGKGWGVVWSYDPLCSSSDPLHLTPVLLEKAVSLSPPFTLSCKMNFIILCCQYSLLRYDQFKPPTSNSEGDPKVPEISLSSEGTSLTVVTFSSELI